MATLRYIEGSAKFVCSENFTGFDILNGSFSDISKIGVIKGTIIFPSISLRLSFYNENNNTENVDVLLGNLKSYSTLPSGITEQQGVGLVVTEGGLLNVNIPIKKFLEYKFDEDELDFATIGDQNVKVSLRIETVDNTTIPDLAPYYVVGSHLDLPQLLPNGCQIPRNDAFINYSNRMLPVCKEVEVTKGSARAKTYVFNTATNYTDSGRTNTFVRGSWGSVKGVDDPWFICCSSINNEVTLLTMPSSVLGSSVKSMTDVVTVTASNASGKLKISIKRD